MGIPEWNAARHIQKVHWNSWGYFYQENKGSYRYFT
jgi:hypothetical protein